MSAFYRTQRRVEFGDTDMAGIAHFTNFLRFMEEAEHEFLRSRGLSVVLSDEKGSFGFPKLSAHCEFQKPVRFEDVLDIAMTIECSDGKILRYGCEFHRDGNEVATGNLSVACCRFPKDELPYAIPIPPEIIRQLGVSP